MVPMRSDFDLPATVKKRDCLSLPKGLSSKLPNGVPLPVSPAGVNPELSPRCNSRVTPDKNDEICTPFMPFLPIKSIPEFYPCNTLLLVGRKCSIQEKKGGRITLAEIDFYRKTPARPRFFIESFDTERGHWNFFEEILRFC